MTIIVVTSIAAIAPILAAILVYINSRKISSGDVSTTTADRLWTEMEAMKNEYKSQASDLRVVVAELQTVCAGLRERVIVSERQNDLDRVMLADCIKAQKECHAREAILQAKISRLERNLL